MHILLWIGKRHAGKTTALGHFLFSPSFPHDVKLGGFLARSSYDEGKLRGFELEDVQSHDCVPLVVRTSELELGGGVEGERVGPFTLLSSGFSVGKEILRKAVEEGTESSILIVVDEYGPLELTGRGWGPSVNEIIQTFGSRTSPSAVILVVREELASRVESALQAEHSSISQIHRVNAIQEGIAHADALCTQIFGDV
jgi:nucleoside-triphosphatase THEP1